ncbi:hypothetical protein BV394_11545 [Brevirhabdus pacifica]|uniref:SPOR domain-containing protein n=1 Tax=Brevirhabdus pacifica TaxID=1267768 RepID=A0A1U7DK73_9RHOB|nr:hypothetical protein BV394_11545 [Brevirhabdus pacifica]
MAAMVAALALAGMTAGAATAQAQTLRNSSGPAERPPASYTGKQFVDSKGCIYVRAGFGGNTTWVPRVDRSRKVVCGARPTAIVGAEKVDPPATTVNPTVTEPPRAVVLKPAPVVVPKPVVRQVVRKPVAVAKPKPKSAPKPARTVAKPRVTARPACDYGPASSAYVNSGTRYPVRCGPQAQHPADAVRAPVNRGLNDNTGIAVKPRLNVRGSSKGAVPVTRSAITNDVVIAPPRPVTIPRGYKRTWDDGRLNPKRGIGKLSGELASSLIWTRTVPRRLIDATTGEDVTVRYGFLRYPYVSYAQQKRALLAEGAPIHEIDVQTRAAPRVTTRTITPSARARTTRTPSETARTTKNAAKSGQAARLVSVGVYSDQATIDRAVARLRSIGLTPRLGRTSGGTIVAAGPYAPDDAARVLEQARRAGFPAASLR